MTDGPHNYLLRFLSKFTFDVLPAALASVIGGFLFAQYHVSAPATPAAPPKPAAEAAAALQAKEAMQMVRDEHALIVDYLKAQRAVEEKKAAEERMAMDQARQDAAMTRRDAEAKAAAAHAAEAKRAAEASRRLAQAQAAKEIHGTISAQSEQPPPAAVRAPLAITPAVSIESPPLVKPRGPLDTVAETAGELKDKAIAAVDEIKEWFVAAGDRILGRRGDTQSATGRLTSLW
jgi:hypothetical protein